MDPALILVQALNGVQLGVMLFLIAAGLTLVFGVMDLINLAHGSLYMVGAYLTATFAACARQLRARPAGRGAADRADRRRARADHAAHPLRPQPPRPGPGHLRPDPVLQRAGQDRLGAERGVPEPARVPRRPGELLPGVTYPAIRLAIILVGLAVALLLWWLIARTRLGMLIRAGASNRTMVERARGRHQPHLHRGVRARRRPRGARRRHGRLDPRGPGRHGRGDPDPRLRGHRDRRARLDQGRPGRRAPGRHRRHLGPDPPARSVRPVLPTRPWPTASAARSAPW